MNISTIWTRVSSHQKTILLSGYHSNTVDSNLKNLIRTILLSNHTYRHYTYIDENDFHDNNVFHHHIKVIIRDESDETFFSVDATLILSRFPKLKESTMILDKVQHTNFKESDSRVMLRAAEFDYYCRDDNFNVTSLDELNAIEAVAFNSFILIVSKLYTKLYLKSLS